MSEAVKQSDLIIKGLAKEAFYQAAVTQMIVTFPFLGIPGIKQVFTFFADKFAVEIFTQLATVSAFVIIDHEELKHLQSYRKAAEDLRFSLEYQTPERIQEAKNEFKKRLSDLIRMRPS